ncbi:HNH endonuclease [Nocardia uniformis]|uniref:HNH endonuclease n=1 Tax=Nocardia uniformis TaxID=53432 RepID=A0A849BUV9_9NOCA|nr:HNH endonuclease signature motif containing protein [Nocardia uniformis]NNH68676.1 HNH endonuclease [Nocardia uniformis]
MPTGGSKQVRAARKRKKRMASVTHDLTDAQWDALKTSWGGCAYCGSATTSPQKDCVQAISRGGRYTLGNVVPACGSCNASKCNAEVTGWLRRKKLDERSFLVRHYEISTELTTRFASGESLGEVRQDSVGPPEHG